VATIYGTLEVFLEEERATKVSSGFQRQSYRTESGVQLHVQSFHPQEDEI